MAIAGDGPWTLSGGERNLFLGADWYRFQDYAGGDGDTRQMGPGVTSAGFTGFWTVGLSSGVELEVKVPVVSVRVDDPEAAACAAAPRAGWCANTSGIGNVGATVKGRAIDELRGAPLSLALVAAARSGEPYARDRGRLTTPGDAQTDVGAGVTLGRTDVAGRGWYRASAETLYWQRFAHRTDGADGGPANEISWSTAAVLAPRPRFSIGPAATGFHRLGGGDLEQADLQDINAFPSLKATQVQAGAKAAWYGENDGPTLAVTVLRTVWARNNPADTLVISAGVGWFSPRKPTAAPAAFGAPPLPDLPAPPAPSG